MFKFVELFHNKGTNVYIYSVEENTTVQTPVLQNNVILVGGIIYIWKSEYVHNICTLWLHRASNDVEHFFYYQLTHTTLKA